MTKLTLTGLLALAAGIGYLGYQIKDLRIDLEAVSARTEYAITQINYARIERNALQDKLEERIATTEQDLRDLAGKLGIGLFDE